MAAAATPHYRLMFSLYRRELNVTSPSASGEEGAAEVARAERCTCHRPATCMGPIGTASEHTQWISPPAKSIRSQSFRLEHVPLARQQLSGSRPTSGVRAHTCHSHHVHQAVCSPVAALRTARANVSRRPAGSQVPGRAWRVTAAGRPRRDRQPRSHRHQKPRRTACLRTHNSACLMRARMAPSGAAGWIRAARPSHAL